MMNWFFRWWSNGFQRMQEQSNAVVRAQGMKSAMSHFDNGMHFQLVKAENGHILKVTIPDDNPQNFHHSNSKEKLYVIPEGEEVMNFVTRAVVEERLK